MRVSAKGARELVVPALRSSYLQGLSQQYKTKGKIRLRILFFWFNEQQF